MFFLLHIRHENLYAVMTNSKRFEEEWEMKRLDDFTDCTAGGTPSTLNKEYWGGTIRWMSSGELNNKIVQDVERRITERGLRESSAKIVPPKCVLIGLAGQGKTRGTVAINLVEICTNQSIAAIYPNESFVPEYLYYNLDSRYHELRGMSTGDGGRGGLNLRIIRSISIPFPKISEQHAIAETLSDVDRLLVALDTLIKKKRDIKLAVMQQLLTGKTRLPGFSGKWNTISMGDIGSIYGGLSAKNKVDFESGNARYVTFLSVINNIIISINHVENVHVASDETQNLVLKGDLLFNGTSETPDELAMGAVMGEHIDNLYLNSFCFGFRFHNEKKYVPLFFAYFFRGYPGRACMNALSQGATRYNLSKHQFASLLLTIPEFAEQQAIATVLCDMDEEIASLERRSDKIRSIKRGVMQALLTGRIRLMKQEVASEIGAEIAVFD